MANKHRGEVSLLVGEDEYTLRLTINKAIELESMGYDLIAGLPGTFTAMRDLFFVCMKGQHGLSTVEEVGEIMQEAEGVAKAFEAVTTLFFLNLAEQTKKETP